MSRALFVEDGMRMNVMKSLAIAALIAQPVLGIVAGSSVAFADPATTASKPADAKPAEAKADATDKKFTKAQIEAFLTKCSDEADAKGLDIKKGKGAARKVFRRECMHKFGVDPK